jgi:hypothetical protein
MLLAGSESVRDVTKSCNGRTQRKDVPSFGTLALHGGPFRYAIE